MRSGKEELAYLALQQRKNSAQTPKSNEKYHRIQFCSTVSTYDVQFFHLLAPRFTTYNPSFNPSAEVQTNKLKLRKQVNRGKHLAIKTPLNTCSYKLSTKGERQLKAVITRKLRRGRSEKRNSDDQRHRCHKSRCRRAWSESKEVALVEAMRLLASCYYGGVQPLGERRRVEHEDTQLTMEKPV